MTKTIKTNRALRIDYGARSNVKSTVQYLNYVDVRERKSMQMHLISLFMRTKNYIS